MGKFHVIAFCQPPNHCGCTGKPKEQVVAKDMEAETEAKALRDGEAAVRKELKEKFPLATLSQWDIECRVFGPEREPLVIKQAEIVLLR